MMTIASASRAVGTGRISELTPYGTAQSINFDRQFSADCSIPKSWPFETLLPGLMLEPEMGVNSGF